MAELVEEAAAAALIEGKSVAVVGNSADILGKKHGPAIDAADVVIRMNAGKQPGNELNLGTKTTIQTIGRKVFMADCPDRAQVWWFKLTASGRKEIQEVLDGAYPQKVWDWPRRYEDRVREIVGADGSSGVRVLWALTHLFQPTRISTYGITCWGRLTGGAGHSTWNRRGPTKSHNPDKEAAAIRALGFTNARTGVMVWRPSTISST